MIRHLLLKTHPVFGILPFHSPKWRHEKKTTSSSISPFDYTGWCTGIPIMLWYLDLKSQRTQEVMVKFIATVTAVFQVVKSATPKKINIDTLNSYRLYVKLDSPLPNHHVGITWDYRVSFGGYSVFIEPREWCHLRSHISKLKRQTSNALVSLTIAMNRSPISSKHPLLMGPENVQGNLDR